ncbi:MAG: hypothetical protein IPI73_25070 [Betaproteobacteria bacterium]|nr:hypothetical protein [Betaproteobacteria bacterium]
MTNSRLAVHGDLSQVGAIADARPGVRVAGAGRHHGGDIDGRRPRNTLVGGTQQAARLRCPGELSNPVKKLINVPSGRTTIWLFKVDLTAPGL